jgi:hypothetical protein
MEMLYRPDWPEVAARWEAWWAGESLGRPGVWIETPKDGVEARPVPAPGTLEACWTDEAYLVARFEEACQRTAYFGEAYPCFVLNVGPCCVAGYIGCPVHIAPSTVWFEHILDSFEGYHVTFDESDPWWQATRRITQAAVDAGAGKWMVDIADIGAACDVLSYLRTPKGLCMDLLDCPEEVARVRDELTALVFRLYGELEAIIHARMDGSTCWARLWAPGRMYMLQNDFSCMVSKRTYDAAFLPELLQECAFFPYNLYHLDGPGAIQHLDTLLETPTLGGVQWIPGAGNPPAADPVWRPMLKRIQAAGKKLQVYCDPGEALELAQSLSPDGLFLSTWAGSEAEGKELLEAVGRA